MRGLLVHKCVDILKVFCAQNSQDLWVNEITRRVIETTGSKDVPAIKEAIKMLESALLIRTIHVNKQKQIKIITSLGQVVSNFIWDLKKCGDSYTRLKNAIIENNIAIGDAGDIEEIERILRSKLLARGWTHDEIPYFKFIMRSAFRMEMIYRNNIFNSILHRYSVISGEYVVNEEADQIIQKSMMNEIQSLFMLARDLEQITSGFTKHYFNPETSEYKDIPFVDLFSLILGQLEDYYHEESVLINKSISNAIEEVTLSLLLLWEADTEDIEESIKFLRIPKNKGEDKILSMIKRRNVYSDSYLIEDLSLIKLRNVFQKYLEISQKSINKLEELKGKE